MYSYVELCRVMYSGVKKYVQLINPIRCHREKKTNVR